MPWFNNTCLFQQRLRTVSSKAPIFLSLFFVSWFFLADVNKTGTEHGLSLGGQSGPAECRMQN